MAKCWPYTHCECFSRIQSQRLVLVSSERRCDPNPTTCDAELPQSGAPRLTNRRRYSALFGEYHGVTHGVRSTGSRNVHASDTSMSVMGGGHLLASS